MSFHSLVGEGINRIYEEDLDTQKHYLSILMKEVRDYESIDILLEAKAFFVPNNDYIAEFFGPECFDERYDLYTYDRLCLWDNYIIFPVTSVSNRIVGLTGFDPITRIRSREEEVLDTYYRYSNKLVWERGNYFYGLPGVYEKSISDGYVVVVDGIFDMLSFSDRGVNCISLLGSRLSENILFALSFIDTIFVAEDNDDAGRRLYSQLKKVFPKTKYLRQNVFKDADDILKSQYGDMYLKEVKRAISNNVDLVLRLKP